MIQTRARILDLRASRYRSIRRHLRIQFREKIDHAARRGQSRCNNHRQERLIGDSTARLCGHDPGRRGASYPFRIVSPLGLQLFRERPDFPAPTQFKTTVGESGRDQGDEKAARSCIRSSRASVRHPGFETPQDVRSRTDGSAAAGNSIRSCARSGTNAIQNKRRATRIEPG